MLIKYIYIYSTGTNSSLLINVIIIFVVIIQGYILTSEIDGTIQMKSYLTGNPEIRLALNEDLSIGRGGTSAYGTSPTYDHTDIMFCMFTTVF